MGSSHFEPARPASHAEHEEAQSASKTIILIAQARDITKLFVIHDSFRSESMFIIRRKKCKSSLTEQIFTQKKLYRSGRDGYDSVIAPSGCTYVGEDEAS